jgi:hypothetical protein
MVSKTKMTFAVPSSLKNDLQQRVISDGYGLRGKSKWVSEAITKLFKYENHIDLIHYGDEFQGLDNMETIVLDVGEKSAVEKKIIDVRKKYPELEGVKSRILRTAIVQRLLRGI